MDIVVGKRRAAAAALGALAALTLVLPAAGAPAPGAVGVSTDQPRYVRGERVLVTVTNDSGSRVRVEDPIEIMDSEPGEIVATYSWSGSHTLRPGEKLEWNWDQWKGECVDDCPHPEIYPPMLVDPGRYVAQVHTDQGTFGHPFSIGQYFTLRFEGGNERFGIFTFDAETIDQLTAEAEAEEKSLIVSGTVVRNRAAYNSGWSFSMKPRSIVAAETFTEVCDARPGYVEQHLSQWAGKRWCPWASYVSSVGTP